MKHFTRIISILLISALFGATGCAGDDRSQSTSSLYEDVVPTEDEIMHTYQAMRDSLSQQFHATFEAKLDQKAYTTEFSETSIPAMRSLSQQTPPDSTLKSRERP